MVTITLDAFVKKWTGHKVDFDGFYGAQCVDLVLQYLKEVLNFAPFRDNAIDEFGENPNHWTWTRNNPKDLKQLPTRGDVMIWGADRAIGTSALGHTAIVLAVFPTYFISFDQNWPIGAAPHQVRHSYEGIVGWGHPILPVVLVPKAPVNPPLVSPAPVTVPIPVQEVPPVAVNPPSIDIPEPGPVAEAGVTTSEWKAFLGYVVQAAMIGTGAVAAKLLGHPLDAPTITLIVQFEGIVAIPVVGYIVSRGLRKLGTSA